MTLRFVPYIGAGISAIFPLVVAAAVGPGWTMVLWTAALFLLVEPVVGHVIEPTVYGRSSGLSPVAVVASATFWTWLWGPVGLVLATPLTVCLVVLGLHVERLKFLEVLLSDRPALTPIEVTYQRMLAGDPTETAEQADSYLKERPLITYYEEVLMGGLRLAQADLDQGELDDQRLLRIRNTVAEVVDDLKDHEDVKLQPAEFREQNGIARLEAIESRSQGSDDLVARPELGGRKGAFLCIPGGGVIDEAVAIILAQLLERQGIVAQAKEAHSLSMEKLFALDVEDSELICLCYIQRPAIAQLRYAWRRIRRRAPLAKSLIFAHSSVKDRKEVTSLPEGIGIVEGSLEDAVRRITQMAAETAESVIGKSAVS